MLTGTFSEELEVKVNAGEFWKVYSTDKLAGLLVEKLPNFFKNIEVIEGDGGVGTVVKVTFAPDNLVMPGLSYQIEKYTVIDNEKRVKVVEIVEGEILALGFTKLQIRSELFEKDEKSCITKLSVEYEIKEEAADKLAFLNIKPFVTIMNVISDALIKAKEDDADA